ncbi:hypothetical protein GQ457_11G020140 [Hibiscus cannabinus]
MSIPACLSLYTHMILPLPLTDRGCQLTKGNDVLFGNHKLKSPNVMIYMEFVGYRFNPIYEDVQVTEGVTVTSLTNDIAITSPDHKHKGKQTMISKQTRVIHVRKPLQVTLNNFLIIPRSASKVSSSCNASYSLKATHLDKSRHSAIVLAENLDPNLSLVASNPSDTTVSHNTFILGDPPDTHTKTHPKSFAYELRQNHDN